MEFDRRGARVTVRHRTPTPVDGRPGGGAVVAPSVSDEGARSAHPEGWQALKPCLRVAWQSGS